MGAFPHIPVQELPPKTPTTGEQVVRQHKHVLLTLQQLRLEINKAARSILEPTKTQHLNTRAKLHTHTYTHTANNVIG